MVYGLRPIVYLRDETRAAPIVRVEPDLVAIEKPLSAASRPDRAAGRELVSPN